MSWDTARQPAGMLPTAASTPRSGSGLRRSVSGDLSVSWDTQGQVLRFPQREGAHDDLLTWDQLSGISRRLTHARLGIRSAESSVEDVAGGLIGETRVKPARGCVAPDLARHCPFES